MHKILQIAIKTLQHGSIILICYLAYAILKAFSLLNFLDVDIIPLLTMQSILVIGGILVIAGIIELFCNHKLTEWNVFIRTHKTYMEYGIFICGIVAFYKSNYIQSIILGIELITIHYITGELRCKEYCYYDDKKNKKTEITNYVEKPVVGREQLTEKQIAALNQLEKLIDKRSLTDSFNIGLIGEWGSGKTSITDTLVYEFQNRKKSENRYFCLKIGALTLNETKNIIEYIKGYFEELFELYGISILNAKSAGAFLESLAKIVNSTESNTNFGEFFSGIHLNSFLDIENQRTLFIEQVQKLLRRSGRKNIIFIIDDADRSDNQAQIIKLLVEFSSIDGLISVVSLDKKNDLYVRPGQNSIKEADKDEKSEMYDYIDKFIHIRIRIEREAHIEYEESIKKQILNEFRQINKKENVYITCNFAGQRISLFDTSRDYPTTEIISKNYMNGQSGYNILAELFFVNLQEHKMQMGEYLEGLINEFLYQTKELFPYVMKMLTTDPKNWGIELHMMRTQWTNVFQDEKFDYLFRLFSNTQNLYGLLWQGLEALDYIKEASALDQNDVRNIEDVYEYYMIKKWHMPGVTWENRKEKNVQYCSFEQQKLILFEKEEVDEINLLIMKREYDTVKQRLNQKLSGTCQLYLSSLFLREFMEYVRNTMNNYRRFKMQLREAELLNLNYLDYLLHEWRPSKQLQENVEQMQQQLQAANVVNIGIPSIKSFINMVLYENYISKYGTRFNELENRRMYIVHGKERNIIVISEREGKDYRYLDCKGNEIKTLRQEEIDAVGEKNTLIWKS